ncbi:hypothetical protein F4803DRAFT_551310 [Xylaria telfairii]|nr:hypothetical protein F4803DRAFT_551310 [Xylaria telfairii]
MCFAEYLAYTCGHTSIAVNRPCPMTTHLHNNPCCPRPACRPFLAQVMCTSCNRILHARRVDIAEYEHRWMHERGACGCDVQFPALLHPRIVQRSTAVADDGASGAGSASVRPEFVPRGGRGTGRQPESLRRGKGAEIPLYQEAQVGENVEVAVRLSSLYAAEWTNDHAKLHKSGQCNCPVSFERYKPLDIEDDQDEHNNPEPDQAWKASYSPSFPKEASHPVPPPAAASSYQTNMGGPARGNNPADNVHNPHEYDQIPPGNVARWAMEGPPASLLDEILGPVRNDASVYGGRPADLQTVHYTTPGVPISGYPIICGPFPESEDELPSIVDFQQPDVTIAGFPIGAGPEGESHARDFETCSLKSSSSEGCSPVMMRRLSSEF